MSDSTNSFIDALLESNIWGKAGISPKAAAKETITESAAPVAEEVDEDVHMCPLCESTLSDPLDRENVELFVEALLMEDDEDVISEDVEDSEDEDYEDAEE